MNRFITYCAFALAVAQLIFVANFFYSLFRGRVAGRNDWQANTLEWSAPSPPPHGNFEHTPVVRRGAYEYSHPDHDADVWPQDADREKQEMARV